MTQSIPQLPELLNCPFCGHDKPSFERTGTGRHSCIVACGNCGARHESSDEYERSGDSWNTRSALSQPMGVARGWQPIETAPKDGTRILAWSEEYGARETRMNFYGEGSPGHADWKAGRGPRESGWDWSEPKNNWGFSWKPTHWMPLLATPSIGPSTKGVDHG